MNKLFNVYCDESNHLENDAQKVMTLGAIWIPQAKKEDISKRLREIKVRNNISEKSEVKWTKISPSNVRLYLDLVDYFFDDDDIHFRVLVIPDKSILRHNDFSQTHDDWYYKMYFNLLKVVLQNENSYNIFIDIKDTRGGEKIRKLKEVLQAEKYDYNRNIVKIVQQIRSHETELSQLVDILIGAVMAKNRGGITSTAKQKVIDRIIERSEYSLVKNTLLLEKKFNVFVWHPEQD